MRAPYLTVLVLISGYLPACQQQEAVQAPVDIQDAAVKQVEPIAAVTDAEVVSPVESKGEKGVINRAAKPVAKEEVLSIAPLQPPVEKGEVDAAVAPVEAADKGSEAKADESVEGKQGMPEPVVSEQSSSDAVRGAKLAKGKCGACHYFDKERKKVGPTLMGIYNRAPTIDRVPYGKWDSTALDAWLTNPKAVKPKTRMGFKGIPEKAKRDDIIAYLKTL